MSEFNKRENAILELKHWFQREKRNFPWRENPSPYEVWVSEVMLQQTRASVVIPYYTRWMKQFPSPHKLAQASETEVMKMWEGLGYYSRARALWNGAKWIVKHFNGEIPSDPELLSQIPGVGPYTSGAIRSFAFRQKAPAVDGNVLRVISRFYGYQEEIQKSSARKWIQERVEMLLPDQEPWEVMEALIELGAIVCGKKPLCPNCPMQDECMGYLQGKANQLPLKKKKPPPTILHRIVHIIQCRGDYLLRKETGKTVMSGLYQFPYFENEHSSSHFFPYPKQLTGEIPHIEHTFTRFKAILAPKVWISEEKREINGYSWVSWKKLKQLPFSSGHKRIIEFIEEEYAHLTH